MAYEVDWTKGIVTTPAKPDAASVDTSFLDEPAQTSPGGGGTDPNADPNAPPAQSQPPGFTTEDWNVGDEQLVESRVESIIDKNSPLMQQAETQAKQEANKRGLINSSMAVGSGQQAVLNAALPIAAQDADTYRQAAQFNAGQANTMTGQKLGIHGQLNLADLNAQNNLVAQNLDNQFKAALAESDIASRTQIEAMGNFTRETLAQIEANYQTLLGANASAQQMYGTSMQNITDILSNTNMDAASKENAITTQLEMLRTGVGVLDKLNALDLSSVLDFSAINPVPA